MDYLGIRVWIDSRLCFRTVLIPRASLAYNFLMLTFAAAVGLGILAWIIEKLINGDKVHRRRAQIPSI